MKQKRLCMAAAILMLGTTYASAQFKITPEAGISIYRDGAKNEQYATISPRLGVGVDYFFNKQENGWGVMSGLYFYQKRNNDSYGYLNMVNEKGDVIHTPFQPTPTTAGGGYGYGSYPSGYGSLDALPENLQLQSVSSYYVTNRREYLQLPIMLKYRWQLNDTYSLSFAAGGYVAVGVGGKRHTDVITYGSEGNTISNKHEKTGVYDGVAYDRFETGFSSRVSFQANRFSLNLNYETNLNRRYNWTNHDNLISLTAGFTF